MRNSLMLELEFGECNGTMSVEISGRAGVIATANSSGVIQTEISLPNRVMLTITGKNYATDTKVDESGNIVADKFVKLKSMSLGGIEFRPNLLVELCEYHPDSADQPEFNTEWFRNGQVTIDFFDQDFVRFHLHYKNTI